MAHARVAPAEQPYGLGQRLRRRSQHLTPLDIVNDHTKNAFFRNIIRQPVTVEETRAEGRMLLGNFIAEEIEMESDIETPQELREKLSMCDENGYKKSEWAKAGQDLRMYADEFLKSKERRKVRRRAQDLMSREGVENVTRDQFRELLASYLPEHITRDDIIILFYFCSDVMIELLKKGIQGCIELCQRFIDWSVEFIMESVCTWIQNHGGWSAVYGNSVKFIAKVAVVFGIGVVGYFGYRKLSNLLR